MGLAGFGTAIVDKGGAYRARAATLTSFLLGSLSAAIRNHTRMHQELEAARSVLATTRRGRAGETRRGERLLALPEEADQTMTSIVGLADALEANLATGDDRIAVAQLLDEFAARAHSIAGAIEDEASSTTIPPLSLHAAALGPSPRIQHVSAQLRQHFAAHLAAGINLEQRTQEPDTVLVGIAKKDPCSRRSPII